MFVFFAAVFCVALALTPGQVRAQNSLGQSLLDFSRELVGPLQLGGDENENDTEREEQQESLATESFSQDLVDPKDIPSILFTYWERQAIDDAKRARLKRLREEAPAEQPETSEQEALPDDFEDEPEPILIIEEPEPEKKIKPPPEKREIRLSGILYTSSNDWTIWLNGQRLTPGAVPEEIIDIQVYEEYIELRWFDDYSNQIFPVRLRPNQRFNIDSRIFLPG